MWSMRGKKFLSMSEVEVIESCRLLCAFFARLPDSCMVLFRYYLLGGDTAAQSGLYTRLCHAFLVFFTMSNAISVSTGPIFTIFFTRWNVFAWIFSIRSSFSDSSRDVAMATNFVSYWTCSLWAKVSQYPLDRFSQYLHHMVGIELQIINPAFFVRYLKGHYHGNQFYGKIVVK